MKKIFFNGGILLNERVYGVQRFASETLKELDNLVNLGEVKLIIPNGGSKELKFNNIEVIVSDNSRQSKLDKIIWDQFTFPNYVKKHGGVGIDLIVALPLQGIDITMVHDCRTIIFPDNAKSISERLKRLFYKERVKASVKKSRLILAPSESAKADICRLFDCTPSKIKVIYEGWQHFQKVVSDETVIDELQLCEKEYFFSLGSQMRHKNIRWVIEAAKQNPQYTFVVTGSSDVNEFDYEIRKNVPDNVIYTGYLSDEKVKSLMKHCKAFIQPSMYEGFGIPPMEAMSVGAKCIVSNVSSLPEVYGNSVWYIDPLKYDDIDLDVIMKEPIEDNRVILDKYSWRKTAEQLYEVIKGI